MSFLLKAFQRWTHLDQFEWFNLIFVVLPDKIVILLIFLVRIVIDALRLSQVKSIGLLLGLMQDTEHRHGHPFLMIGSVATTHENIPAVIIWTVERVSNNLMSWRNNSFANFSVVVTPVTFESHTGLIPLLFESSRRIWLIEVAQNWWVIFFAPLIFLIDLRLLLDGIVFLLWWHEILTSVLLDRREDPSLVILGYMRMSPWCIKNLLRVGQDRWHILIWTRKPNFFVVDQLLFDWSSWGNRVFRNRIIRFRQPFVEKTQFVGELDRIEQVLFSSVLELLKLVWILCNIAQLILKIARWGNKTTPIDIVQDYFLVHKRSARRSESWVRL